MKRVFIILFVVIGIVSGVSIVRYARTQSLFVQEKANHELDRAHLLRLQNNQAFKDAIEGIIMPQPLLPKLPTVTGHVVNLDSMSSLDDGIPTLVLLFSLRGCNACLHQELDLIESDSVLVHANCRVVYICIDSLEQELSVNFEKLWRAKHLKFPAFEDSTDSIRRRLRLTSVSLVELLIVDRRILYATLPSSSDREASVNFFRKVKRMANSQSQGTSHETPINSSHGNLQ